MDYPSTHEYVLRVLKYAEDFRYDFEPGPQDPAVEMILSSSARTPIRIAPLLHKVMSPRPDIGQGTQRAFLIF